MNAKLEALQRIAMELRELFGTHHLSLSVCSDGDISLSYHGCETYKDATRFLRDLGFDHRVKDVQSDYTVLTGKIDKISVTTFPHGLPPTCRKVKVTERVPKVETRETGDFIEVTREVIQCGPETGPETIKVL